MKAEVHYSKSNRRTTFARTGQKYIIPASPLTMTKWWRVVLDEAQMVDTPTNNCSRMVKSLPGNWIVLNCLCERTIYSTRKSMNSRAAVHRWSVTGTPIEKSIDNLYGLLFFLDYEPYTDFSVWKNLTLPFHQGDMQSLVDECLKNVMWRTCKVNVWQEIGLPPQTEIVHHVTMSDSQAFFYKHQHDRCERSFFENVRKLGKSLSMFKMDSKTLKLVSVSKCWRSRKQFN